MNRLIHRPVASGRSDNDAVGPSRGGLFALFVIAVLTLPACSLPRPPAVEEMARPPTSVPTPRIVVKIGLIGGRQVLVDGAGRALYLFTRDRVDYSACPADCVDNWPALVGPALAGPGVDDGALGTFTRSDGELQVTYFGSQLYYFGGDARPGEAKGQAIGRAWYLVDKDGSPIPS
jgi:predicted lipoprotein with Yx(FWY)xxD motif